MFFNKENMEFVKYYQNPTKKSYKCEKSEAKK